MITGSEGPAGAIDATFDQDLQRRRELFREYFWRAGNTPESRLNFWKMVGETPAGQLRVLRRKAIDGVGSLFRSGKMATLWQSDGVLTIGEDVVSTKEVVRNFAPNFMRRQTGELRPAVGEVDDQLAKLENGYVDVAQKWLQQYQSVHRDVENMVDELSSRSFQIARIRHHMKRKGFYLQDLPPTADPDEHMMTIKWYQDGKEMEMKKGFKNKRSTLAFIKEFEAPVKKIQGGYFSRGALEDRVLDQAFLWKRLELLERDIRSFLQNQGLSGNPYTQGPYSPQQLAPLQRFYDQVKGALRQTAITRYLNQEMLRSFDPANPQHGYEISDWATAKRQNAELWDELKQFFGRDFVDFSGNFFGKPISKIGQKIKWQRLEEWGPNPATKNWLRCSSIKSASTILLKEMLFGFEMRMKAN